AQNVNQLLDSSFVNGTLYCKYERNAFGTESAIDVDLMSQNFRILVSSGTSVSNTAPSYNNRMASGVSTAYNKPLEKVEARNADLSIYNGCGVSKTCFGMPANCVASQTCESVVTATSIGNRFEFELQTQNSNAGYISLGLSRDHLMGDDSVMECVVENSEVRGYTSWNYRRTNSRVDVSQDIVRLLNSSFANGVLYCKLERMPTSQKRETDFDLLIEDFYFMIALGTAFTSGSISMHNLGRLSSSGPLQILETPPPIYEPPPVYDGCGTEKTCFGFPDNCLEEQSCRAVVTAAFVNEKYVFELQSSVNGTRYVAFGLSKDEFMGSDSVIECIAEGGNITAHTSWNTPRTTFENTRQGVQQYIITLLNSSYTDGTLYCKVERQAVTTVIEKTFDLDNDHFYYMVAIGSIVRENSVGMHNLGRDVSSEPLRFPGREDEGEGGANGLAKISVVALLVSFLATNFLR
ncbi:putative ferric-chelate reductase 1 like, partial [Pseudolycoriella hygida]